MFLKIRLLHRNCYYYRMNTFFTSRNIFKNVTLKITFQHRLLFTWVVQSAATPGGASMGFYHFTQTYQYFVTSYVGLYITQVSKGVLHFSIFQNCVNELGTKYNEAHFKNIFQLPVSLEHQKSVKWKMRDMDNQKR